MPEISSPNIIFDAEWSGRLIGNQKNVENHNFDWGNHKVVDSTAEENKELPPFESKTIQKFTEHTRNNLDMDLADNPS